MAVVKQINLCPGYSGTKILIPSQRDGLQQMTKMRDTKSGNQTLSNGIQERHLHIFKTLIFFGCEVQLLEKIMAQHNQQADGHTGVTWLLGYYGRNVVGQC